MNKIIFMALAAALVSSCSKEEEKALDINGPKEQLNILTRIQNTRAVVEGTTLPKGSVIGVHVTEPDSENEKVYVGQKFTGDATNLTILENGENVNFTFGESNWDCKTSDGNGAAKLMIGATTGTIYAFYPRTTTTAITGIGKKATIPVTIENEGKIIVPENQNEKKNFTTEKENDWLYYKPSESATRVDGATRATVSSTTTATATLTMAHAMARVSFRMYVSKDAPTVGESGDEKYYLMGYTIKNKQGKTLLCAHNKQESTSRAADIDYIKMNIATGAITTEEGAKGGTIARTIFQTDEESAGYALTRFTGDAGTSGNDTGTLLQFSNLVVPIASISQETKPGISDDLEVVFSIRKGEASNGSNVANYTVPLAVTETSTAWEAGKNYIYTVKLSAFLGLSIEQVTVEDWVDVVGGDMVIQ